jgi:hypothetical protein
VLSIHGHTIKTIRNHAFDTLFGIALSNDENTIYVGCLCNDTVFSLDMDGNIKASYTDTDLKRPYGISVDIKGFVYACSYRTGSVHQLTNVLKKVQDIVKDDGVEDCDINKTTNNLYLSICVTVKHGINKIYSVPIIGDMGIDPCCLKILFWRQCEVLQYRLRECT